MSLAWEAGTFDVMERGLHVQAAIRAGAILLSAVTLSGALVSILYNQLTQGSDEVKCASRLALLELFAILSMFITPKSVLGYSVSSMFFAWGNRLIGLPHFGILYAYQDDRSRLLSSDGIAVVFGVVARIGLFCGAVFMRTTFERCASVEAMAAFMLFYCIQMIVMTHICFPSSMPLKAEGQPHSEKSAPVPTFTTSTGESLSEANVPDSGLTAIFGGSFDPPHLGHREIVEALLGHPAVAEVIVIPCGDVDDTSLYKGATKQRSPFQTRSRWVEAMCASVGARVLDVHRDGPVYDIAEVRAVKAAVGSDSHIAVVIGVEYALGAERKRCVENWPAAAGPAADLAEWRSQGLILTLRDADTDAVAEDARRELRANGWTGPVLLLRQGDHPTASSTRVRSAVQAGGQWRDLVPSEVGRFFRQTSSEMSTENKGKGVNRNV